ncbi:Leucine carboxyl methyltransferase family protein [Theileria parva strain Muguga]|uniref:Leucine carboxyl methyltransferase family protein n=1 Tax=Theileria parva strain Muguga TaxID=333668 RepID=UPI001C61CA5D|nr:Leucine carboxyl methyltransferase family protein [Theileria parva strain Muguga]KAF5153194.1 Leucine carboxyl methyltransferase family protein [Theileria parva strain Muguga]
MVRFTEAEEYVQKSAQSAILHKRNAVSVRYYEDEFINHFSDPKPQITITSLIYTIRVKSIRMALDRFIQLFPGETVQFVNLGSGFDTTSFWLIRKYNNVVCFDTDFPDQMKSKSRIIAENDIFRRLLPDLKLVNGFINSTKYKTATFDLTDINGFDNLISAGLSPELPTVYLAEAVFMYIDTNKVDPVLRKLSEFSTSCLIYWEFTNPNDKFGQLTIQTFKENNIELTGVKYSIEEHNQRYLDLGWDEVVSVNMNTMWSLLDPQDKHRIKGLESFNEVEELGVICGHLMLGLAIKNFKESWEFICKLRETSGQQSYT